MRRRWKRQSGRHVPKYNEHLPFNVREELDIHENRTLYDEWYNWRDGIRAPIERNKTKFLTKRNTHNNYIYKYRT
jgi:hypothetical protein